MTRRRPSRPAVPPVALGAGERQALAAPYRALEARTGPQDTWEAVWARSITERQFQAVVRGALERRGWVCWVVPNMKLTTAGLPDILAWHPERPGVLLTWELKTMRGRITDKQVAAYRALRTVDGIDARIVRPSDWPALLQWLDAPAPAGPATPPGAQTEGGEEGSSHVQS